MDEGSLTGAPRRASLASLILRDVQFWVPVVVLVLGLVVLRWIA